MKPNRTKLSVQVAKKVKKPIIKEKPYDGNFETTISTGSTLLDLAIGGTAKRGGGMPGGIAVEIFGPSGTGKTVLLSEIAGAIQRQGGDNMFRDPEARLSKSFASIFDLDFDKLDYGTPDTVTEVFDGIRKWVPSNPNKINGIMADSLAALSTNLEMTNEDGDKMGMRRAKEFSEGFRKTCRILAQRNWLMVCSNQIRTNAEGMGEKHTTPGGMAVGFYCSLRLRVKKPARLHKLKKEVTIAGKKVERIYGILVDVEVYKSSIDKPYRTAPVYIIFDYGIDDIRANLQFIKDYTKNKTYTCNGETLNIGMEKSIQMIEEQDLETELRNEVIDLWEHIEKQFDSNRTKKKRE